MNDTSADAIRAEIADLRARIVELEERHGLQPGYQTVLQVFRAFFDSPRPEISARNSVVED